MGLSLVGEDLTFGSFSASSRPGPYLYGGKLFGVVVKHSTSKLFVYQSDDDGTTWNPVGEGITLATGDSAKFGCDVYENIIYIVHSVTGGSIPAPEYGNYDRIAVSKFDMATQTWLDTSTSAIDTPPRLLIPFFIACRGIDDCVILFGNRSGSYDTGYYYGVYYSLWDGASFGASQRVSEEENNTVYIPLSITNGNGIQISYQANAGLVSASVRLKTLDNNNTLGPYIIIQETYETAYTNAATLYHVNGVLYCPISIRPIGQSGVIGIAKGSDSFVLEQLPGTVYRPLSDSGYMISFADLVAQDYNNQTIVYLPDEGDFSTHVMRVNKVNGIYQVANAIFTSPTTETENPSDVFIREDSKKRIFFGVANNFIYCSPSRTNPKVYYYDDDGFEISIGDSFPTTRDGVSIGIPISDCITYLNLLDPHDIPAAPLMGIYDNISDPIPAGPAARVLPAPSNSGIIYNIPDDEDTLNPSGDSIYAPTE